MNEIDRIDEQLKNARMCAESILGSFRDSSDLVSINLSVDKSAYGDKMQHLNDMNPILRASDLALHGFATLDYSLIKTILALKDNLRDYKKDGTRWRPLNILMIAEPGSGKSHFVKCLAESIDMPYVAADLSAGNPYDVITFALNEARNFKSQDQHPLIFLDEIDSYDSLLPSILPLMWEGQFSARGQLLKVGKCVLVCAATREEFRADPEIRNKGAKHTHPKEFAKLPDFLSRLNGGRFRIDSITEEKRKPDRLAISAALIQRRFETVRAVSIGLLQFLALVPVQHEVRTLEFLVNFIPTTALKSWDFIGGPSDNNAIPLGPWGKDFCRIFSDLLAGTGYLSEGLKFHIPKNRLSEAQEIWNRASQKIDPIIIRPLGC